VCVCVSLTMCDLINLYPCHDCQDRDKEHQKQKLTHFSGN
jgi:hypothetical protein